MERMEINTIIEQFKRTFDEHALNDLGKRTQLCQRERTVTPYRLALSLIEVFGAGRVPCIADLHRGFNALSGEEVRYKPFHNQLAKSGFARFMRELQSQMLGALAMESLRFEPGSAFCQFSHIRIQDGTSFALKSTLATQYPGRWSKQKPAAVELHVDLDLLSEQVNRVVLRPDKEPERTHLPAPDDVSGGLLLADRGYYGQGYFKELDEAGAGFIIRGMSNITPVIVEAIGPRGRRLNALCGKRLKANAKGFNRYSYVDLTVQFKTPHGPWQGRVIVHRNPDKGAPRVLVTNLARDTFTVEQISDAYRLRWQIELLFKEWKSHANLHAFDTSNAHIAEGLIWAALCAATLKRYCAHLTQQLRNVAISTQIVAKCAHHILHHLLHALMHNSSNVEARLAQVINYLAANARRAHPNRDRRKGRLKLGLQPIYGGA